MANHQERPKQGIDADQLRKATFPQAIRGYDRDAVHELLDRVADFLDGSPGAVADRDPDLRRELERVGERTAGILTAAEEAAAKLREEAREYAEAVRREADEESRAARLEASRKAEEIVSAAETRAEEIVDEAIARRRTLDVRLEELTQRRDEIAEETARLADELMVAAEALRSGTQEPDTQPTGGDAEDADAETEGEGSVDQQATRSFEEVGEAAPDAEDGEGGGPGDPGPDASSEPTRLYAVEDADTAVHRAAPES